MFVPVVMADLLLERSHRSVRRRRRRAGTTYSELDALLDELHELVSADARVRRLLRSRWRRREIRSGLVVALTDLRDSRPEIAGLLATIMSLLDRPPGMPGGLEQRTYPSWGAQAPTNPPSPILREPRFSSLLPQPVDPHHRQEHPQQPAIWREMLRTLDTGLASGSLSPEEYRRRRDVLLALALNESDPGPSVAAAASPDFGLSPDQSWAGREPAEQESQTPDEEPTTPLPLTTAWQPRFPRTGPPASRALSGPFDDPETTGARSDDEVAGYPSSAGYSPPLEAARRMDPTDSQFHVSRRATRRRGRRPSETDTPVPGRFRPAQANEELVAAPADVEPARRLSGTPAPAGERRAGRADAAGQVVPRWLVAGMPQRAPLMADISLVVRIAVEASGWPAAAWFDLAALDTTDVSVLVQAPPDLVPRGPLEQVLSVPKTGDSDPLRFPFQTRTPGLHRLQVLAFAGGTFLTELEVEVSVEPGGPTVDGPPQVAAIDEVQARQGEVTLQVRSDGDATVFQLLSDTYLFEPVLAQASAGDSTAAAERAIDTLRQLAQGRGPYKGGTARRWMQETGIGLWQAAVPQLIKEQYWQLRDNITSFTIATSHDVIPWELLYPLRSGSDHGFLVEQFPVLRRVFGQRRARDLAITPCTYVVSARSPENARQEIDSVSALLGKGDIVEDLEELLDVIAAGTCGSLHFTCHNSFDARGSSITMNGGPFVPGLLNSAATQRTLAARSPLVFLNACRTASSIPEYSRMTGWAQQFMAAGAGAFIGTHWPVRSSGARTFAEACYARLHAGDPLGDAVLEARRTAGTDDPDPTWLAYTAYGDPHAIARR